MMTRKDIKRVNRERLARWLDIIDREDALPMMMIALGVRKEVGQLHFLRPHNDIKTDILVVLLEEVLTQLKSGHHEMRMES